MEDYKQNFLKKLTEASLDLNETETVLATYVKENYKKVSLLDLDDVSKILSIEPVHIVRYITKLGFKNYEDLRSTLRDFAMSELSSADRFEFSQISLAPQISNIKNVVIHKELSNLNKLIDRFDEAAFYSLLERIIIAPEIIVVGTRSSSILALYIDQMFNKLGKHTIAITSGATTQLDNLPLLHNEALVLALGFARYPKETVRMVSFFKKRQHAVVSITDHATSPLAPFSDVTFTVPCQSVSITDFYATPFSVINMIIILLSQIDKDRSASYLNRFEDMAKDFGFYF
ncbi:MurR/RpiR family transcriptional regulator [Anoxynatronum sibiricum]|uniref:MurR/RpiR family transcriptional regulator n=1 Tax=Anoxynatronum sibiricum TaxID=210623 RepID=A0ABU9VTB9_9CLOT